MPKFGRIDAIGQSGRQAAERLFVLLHRQRNLMQIAGALVAPGRLRADCTAGTNKAMSVPMMAMTTSSSTIVNAIRLAAGLSTHEMPRSRRARMP